MGLYGWLSQDEFESCSTVCDTGINEALQEVRSVMPEWYIEERVERKKSRWFGNTIKKEYAYTVYHRTTKDGNEVRHQLSANTRDEILNLLYGLYMGYHKAKEDEKNT